MSKKQMPKSIMALIIFGIIFTIGAIIIWKYKPWTFKDHQEELFSRTNDSYENTDHTYY